MITILLAIVFALGLFMTNNMVRALIFLISCFLSVAVFLLFTGLDFYGFLIIIIYVGAIAVLFLFVVMMLQSKNINSNRRSEFLLFLTFIVIPIVCILLYYRHFSGLIDPTADFLEETEGTPWVFNYAYSFLYSANIHQTLGAQLYVSYGFIFVASSILLLVGMIGAILLTLEKVTSTRKQIDYVQLLKKKSTNKLYKKK